LLAEDEQAVQDAIRENLAPFVKRLIVAEDGAVAYDYYSKEHFDVIVTDINMPNMDGLQFTKKVRENDSETPIIITTAYNDISYMQNSIKLDIDAYLQKPIDFEELLATITKASSKVENRRLKEILANSNERLEVEVEDKTKELQQINDKLYKKVYYDDLTGLLSRNSLLDDLALGIKKNIIIVNIDGFKAINDIYGIDAGNQVLKWFARNLLTFTGKISDSKLYRSSADEFVLLVDATIDSELFKKLLKALIVYLKKESTFYYDKFDMDIVVGATIGVSNTSMGNANIALKEAKLTGQSIKIYNSNLSVERVYREDLKWTKSIKQAIESKNVLSFFQPIVNRDKKVVKAESLIRLLDGNNAPISPGHFMSTAIKTKQYQQLTRIIVHNTFALSDAVDIELSCNLSAEDITNERTCSFILEGLSRLTKPSNIIFELLESESIENFEQVIRFINNVRRYGSKIAIDDFGSGYSNFSYLLDISPDIIKIDGSLIKDLDRNKNAMIIVDTIVSFSKKLGFETVAEFIENESVFNVAKKMGIDYFQGYHFHKPMQAHDIRSIL
jgi:diguanylate cyclase (GGDEF)-like protein